MACSIMQAYKIRIASTRKPARQAAIRAAMRRHAQKCVKCKPGIRIKKSSRMTDDTGEKQAKAGKNGNIPPVDTRFGGARANKRNNKGRPKSFDALRKLAQQIASEELQSTDGDVVTRIEALLRVMSSSRNPADRKTFLEYAFGKPKEEVDVTSGGKPLTWKEFLADADTGADSEKPEAIRGSISKDTDEG